MLPLRDDREWIEINRDYWICSASVISVRMQENENGVFWEMGMVDGTAENSGYFSDRDAASTWLNEYAGIQGVPVDWEAQA